MLCFAKTTTQCDLSRKRTTKTVQKGTYFSKSIFWSEDTLLTLSKPVSCPFSEKRFSVLHFRNTFFLMSMDTATVLNHNSSVKPHST